MTQHEVLLQKAKQAIRDFHTGMRDIPLGTKIAAMTLLVLGIFSMGSYALALLSLLGLAVAYQHLTSALATVKGC